MGHFYLLNMFTTTVKDDYKINYDKPMHYSYNNIEREVFLYTEYSAQLESITIFDKYRN